jgi:NDP-sugar pyrophosphorylase family protein
MLNIVIPMAGAGSRFAKVGYQDPKPLIPVHGQPMIKVVIDNLRPSGEHRFIFICQEQHVQAYDLRPKLQQWAPGCSVVTLDGLTDGAARTVLATQHLIDNSHPLMIANSDQFIDSDIDSYLRFQDEQNLDGLIMTMTAHDPKWSFAETDAQGLVQRVVEKEVISDIATVGIYNFKRGQDFVRAAHQMIAQDMKVNGEFYVAPVYNLLIAEQAKIGVYGIGTDGQGMHGIGTPADLDKFLADPVSASLKG